MPRQLFFRSWLTRGLAYLAFPPPTPILPQVLNPTGRVWLMVAGGGASVIYTDTIADLGYR